MNLENHIQFIDSLLSISNYLIKIFSKKIYNYHHIHEITLNVFKDRESNI